MTRVSRAILAEAKLYINGSPVSANAGTLTLGPSKYVISGTAGDYTTSTVVGGKHLEIVPYRWD